ncbi:MAG TPA: mechanosensitive ion channel family protein [Terriglobales bacterium]|nr:mechanosensitive ion channel family protein [Terriglobales bacterium]
MGRTTPRATVLAFLAAAQNRDYDVAAEYLNTRLRGKAAAQLAKELAVVLDRRLPARLNQLSDKPEGSLLDPLNPDRDLVGTVTTANGDVPIVLERVDRGKSGPVWLFSSKTLEAIPDIYEELEVVTVDSVLPQFLVTNRIGGIPLFEWVAVFLGLPVLYILALLLNRLLSPLVGRLRRQLAKQADLPNPEVLPTPIRLLVIALTIRWLLSKIGLSLLARQFWSSAATVIAVAAIVWILIRVSSRAEQYAHRRLRSRNLTGAASVLRLTRRVVDVLFIFAGILVILYAFGINPTAGLAGLGVGGIAVALAAQKTLENVIAGASMIFDQVVRVGDTLKVGDIVGTVDEIGLRSTRIRTFDRTLVSVPNGQIASMSLETLSVRDKFWFHPTIGLRYGTTATQIHSVVDNVRNLLTEHSSVERAGVRVRFLGFRSSSLDVDVFAYVYANDWSHFLEIQEGLLFSIMEIVQEAGTQIALPSQIMYLADNLVSDPARLADTLKPSRNTLAATR